MTAHFTFYEAKMQQNGVLLIQIFATVPEWCPDICIESGRFCLIISLKKWWWWWWWWTVH